MFEHMGMFTTSRERFVERVSMTVKNRRVNCSQIGVYDFMSNGNGHNEVKNSKESKWGNSMIFEAIHL